VFNANSSNISVILWCHDQQRITFLAKLKNKETNIKRLKVIFFPQKQMSYILKNIFEEKLEVKKDFFFLESPKWQKDNCFMFCFFKHSSENPLFGVK
jgi:hypothetical protein